MADTVFYNKRKLCYTDESDFTDFQGMGGDPLYLRYENVFNIIKHHIFPQYQGFLAQPDYQDGLINWYIDEWIEQPICFDKLESSQKSKYDRIKTETIKHYRQVCSKLPTDEMAILSSALKYIDDRFIYCYDDKVILVAWGMRPDTTKHAVDGRWVKGLEYTQKHAITFDPGIHGSLIEPQRRVATRQNGFKLSKNDIPEVRAKEGYIFKGWSPDPIGYEVNSPILFSAQYEEKSATLPPSPQIPGQPIPCPPPMPPLANCTFLAGDHGIIRGYSVIRKPIGSTINQYDIPKIDPHKGYNFIGWNIQPLNCRVDGDKTFVAQYEKNIPWYKRWWSAIPKWLKWLLLLLLLLLLFSWLFNGCHNFGCTGYARHDDGYIIPIDNVNGRDDNGHIHGIIDEDGHLPNHGAIAPIVDEDGNNPPIIHNDGAPDVVANRLNIYFEDDNANLDQWAQDFKSAYPGDEYQIIGYDPNVRMIQILIPENQRDRLRNELPMKLPRQRFFIVDESVISFIGDFSTVDNPASHGWHLEATKARDGWNITKGSDDVIVAIVDDGIDSSHPIFGNRFYKAYNVFTQDHRLSAGEGHGTHVAGLAVGNGMYLSDGVAGIAQKVKIMPIQVFDNGMCTFSSVASGIMYAIHNGADVVNISIGPKFKGLDQLPLAQQREIAQRYFKNEEQVFRHIIKTANEKNVILVFAAGNDNIMTAILPECRTSQTINVAAVDENLKATGFTNYSAGTNISAPGKDIYSSVPNNAFQNADGTSMAAPIVAGTVALMRSLKPDLNVAQAIGILQKTGKPTDGNNRYVPPMVQIDKALRAVINGDIPNGPVVDMPPIANPETADGMVEVVVIDENGGKDLVAIDGKDLIGGGGNPTTPGGGNPTTPGDNPSPRREKTYTIIDNETGETVTINSDSDDYNSISSLLKRFLPQ